MLDKVVVQLEDARDNLEVRVHERTSKLKAINEELKRFTYIMSHDLRNHLVNFNGFAEELRFSVDAVTETIDEVKQSLTDEQQATLEEHLNEDIPEYLAYINTSVDQMKRMVDAMLTLARMESRQLEPEVIEMRELVREVTTSLSTEIREQDVQIVTNVLPSVKADRFSLERIFTNLIHNAVIYSSPERQPIITIGGYKDNESTYFYVQDNGIGISSDDTTAIFDIFKRAGDNSVAGDGMGLALVKNLVMRHRGTIRCDSQVGVGSRFTFSIADDLDNEELSEQPLASKQNAGSQPASVN
ncbi:MAG: HAMP domain-containing histidine kinase [Anaerolineae bacterium]|nr:HAMP domain-containing histidine kinase [Anaerolineae bacterium]